MIGIIKQKSAITPIMKKPISTKQSGIETRIIMTAKINKFNASFAFSFTNRSFSPVVKYNANGTISGAKGINDIRKDQCANDAATAFGSCSLGLDCCSSGTDIFAIFL